GVDVVDGIVVPRVLRRRAGRRQLQPVICREPCVVDSSWISAIVKMGVITDEEGIDAILVIGLRQTIANNHRLIAGLDIRPLGGIVGHIIPENAVLYRGCPAAGAIESDTGIINDAAI